MSTLTESSSTKELLDLLADDCEWAAEVIRGRFTLLEAVAEAAIPAADSYESLFYEERERLEGALRAAGYLGEGE